MYLPKNLWPVKPHKKLQALGVTTMIGASLIGCSTAEPSTAEMGDTAVSTPTTIATPTLLAAEFTEILPTALAVEKAVSLPPTPVPSTAVPVSAGQYVDGDYLGDSVRTDRWGSTQIIVHIEGGMLVDVEIADYPNSSSRSSQISWAAFPTLISEAVQNQDADIDIVTRATDTSVAFIQSLESALEDAAVGASS